MNRSSDQSFVGVGVPSLWASFSEQTVGEDAIGFAKLFGGNSGGLGWWWHTVHDTVDKIDPALLERDCQCYVAALSRLLLDERLPLDPEAAAASLLAELKHDAAQAGVRCDLSPALDRAERLVAAAAALQTAPVSAAQFNTAARLLSRHLIPVAYTEAGSFGHDPALSVPPVPALKAITDLVATEPDSDGVTVSVAMMVPNVRLFAYSPQDEGDATMRKRDFAPVTTYPKEGTIESAPLRIADTPLLSEVELSEVMLNLGYPFTTFEISLPFCLHLEDGLYPVRMNGEFGLVKLIKEDRPEPLYLGGAAQHVEMQDDPRGLFRFTRACACFTGVYVTTDDTGAGAIADLLGKLDRPALERFSTHNLPLAQKKQLEQDKIAKLKGMKQTQLLDRAVQILNTLTVEILHKLFTDVRQMVQSRRARQLTNRIIEVYRVVCGAEYLPALRATDILGGNMTQYVKPGEVERAVSVVFPHSLTLSVPDRAITEHDTLWCMLEAETPIDVSEQMFQTANRYLLEENYPNAVSEAFSAFELAVERLLTSMLTDGGKSAEEAAAFLTEERNWQISVRVRDIFTSLTKHDLTADSHYNAWVQAKDLRDAVVHRGQRTINEGDARAGVKAISDMLGHMKAVV